MAAQEGGEEAVILVVGPESECKRRFADALAEGREASRLETTKAGCRIWSRETSPLEAVVIDTTPMVVYDGCRLPLNAMKWISANSLRRMLNKLVHLVCVVQSLDLRGPIHEVIDLRRSQFSWLHLLGFIFKLRQGRISVFVRLEGHGLSASPDPEITKVLGKNGFQTNFISFETMRREDLLPAVTIALDRSVKPRVDKATNHTMGPALQALAHATNLCRDAIPSIPYFILEEVVVKLDSYFLRELKEATMSRSLWDTHVACHGAWSSERLIVCGKTGSGKSTVARMLTSGKVDSDSKVFVSSSSIRGETEKVTSGEGRGWYIVDTPGFGEVDDKQSTLPTSKAVEKLKAYVERIEGTYSHFVYVYMKDRIDDLERRIWDFFQLLFGENLLNHFTVVVSNATQEWVDGNIGALQKYFKGCKSFVGCEFPPRADDVDLEAEHEEYARVPSLKRLEDELASQSRHPVTCDFGSLSKQTVAHRKATVASEIDEEKNVLKKVAFSVLATTEVAKTDFDRVMKPLMSKDKIIVFPSF